MVTLGSLAATCAMRSVAAGALVSTARVQTTASVLQASPEATPRKVTSAQADSDRNERLAALNAKLARRWQLLGVLFFIPLFISGPLMIGEVHTIALWMSVI